MHCPKPIHTQTNLIAPIPTTPPAEQGNNNVTGEGKLQFVAKNTHVRVPKDQEPVAAGHRRAQYRRLRRRTQVLATAWDFLEGESTATAAAASSSSSSTATTNIAVFNLSSTRRPNLRDARVRQRLTAWVPERFLRAAEEVQGAGFLEAAPREGDVNLPTLVVGGDVDACRVCNVDSVSGAFCVRIEREEGLVGAVGCCCGWRCLKRVCGPLVKQVAGPKAGECKATGCDAFDYLQHAGARRLITAAAHEDDVDGGFRFVDPKTNKSTAARLLPPPAKHICTHTRTHTHHHHNDTTAGTPSLSSRTSL